MQGDKHLIYLRQNTIITCDCKQAEKAVGVYVFATNVNDVNKIMVNFVNIQFTPRRDNHLEL